VSELINLMQQVSILSIQLMYSVNVCVALRFAILDILANKRQHCVRDKLVKVKTYVLKLRNFVEDFNCCFSLRFSSFVCVTKSHKLRIGAAKC